MPDERLAATALTPARSPGDVPASITTAPA